MKTLWVCVFLGVVVIPCFAAETLTNTCTFGREGKLWDYEDGYGTDHSSVSWTQDIAGFQSGGEITEATLTFTGIGIDNVRRGRDKDYGYEQTDCVTIMLNGQTLGQLTGNTTTFQVSSALLSDTLDFSADITFQNDQLVGRRGRMRDVDWRDLIRLHGVTLDVVYQNPTAEISTPPVSVPAPGALMLAGIGTLVVGILRRRNAI